MNCHKVLLAMFLLIVVTSPSFSERLALQPFSQESDRDRTRDAWQRPAEVFDAMAVKPGHRVADIGSGSGYFTFRLAAKVGAEGKVYAVDIEQKAIDKVRQRKERENLQQVEAILGESNDPHLPNDLDSVLIVDSYHEFREFDRMMQAVFRALKPAGRLVIIDAESPSGRPRTEYHRLHSIPADIVLEELRRNRFVFKESRPGFYDAEYGKKFYLLIFERPLRDPLQETPISSEQSERLVEVHQRVAVKSYPLRWHRITRTHPALTIRRRSLVLNWSGHRCRIRLAF